MCRQNVFAFKIPHIINMYAHISQNNRRMFLIIKLYMYEHTREERFREQFSFYFWNRSMPPWMININLFILICSQPYSLYESNLNEWASLFKKNFKIVDYKIIFKWVKGRFRLFFFHLKKNLIVNYNFLSLYFDWKIKSFKIFPKKKQRIKWFEHVARRRNWLIEYSVTERTNFSFK